jgi:hypothetical protein
MEQFKHAYAVGSETVKGYKRDGELVGAAPVPSRALFYTLYSNTNNKTLTIPWDLLIRSMVIQDNNTATIFTLDYGGDFQVQLARANMTVLAPNFFQANLPHYALEKGSYLKISAAPTTNSWQFIIDVEPADFIPRKLFF